MIMKHIILFLVISSFISKTRAQPNVANFVYRIVITGKEQGKSSIQTGFSVKGQDGIYTALHGIAKKISSDGQIKIRAIRYFPGTSTKRDSIMDLSINKIDVERDLVLLKSKYPIESGLLEISFDLKPISWNTRLNLHGFPETRFLKSNTIEVQNPPLMALSALLEGDTNFEKFAKRNSPSLKVTVIQFDAEHIFPGFG
jgi:hypothetical protein